MGRPGTGGSGSYSSGGHSVGRSSGGHRIGGNSRPGVNLSSTQHNRPTGHASDFGSGFRSGSGSGSGSQTHDSGLDFGKAMAGMMMVNAMTDSFDRSRERELERKREREREERREREREEERKRERDRQREREREEERRRERERRMHEEVFLRASMPSGVPQTGYAGGVRQEPVQQVSQSSPDVYRNSGPLDTGTVSDRVVKNTLNADMSQTHPDSGSLSPTKPPEPPKIQKHLEQPQQPPEPKKPDYIKYICMAASAICMFVLVICLVGMAGSKNTNQVSTKNRAKLEHPVAYDNNNIIDELGYIDDKAKLSRDLQNFYDLTGVLPYVVLKSYDAELTSDEEKTEYAEDYYADHINNEGSMLYMYFAEQDESEVGYMAYVNGTAVKSVMDAEAVDVFWNYLDTYWVDENLSMDEVFVKTFDKTAETIMTKSKTKEDVAFVRYVVMAIVCFGGIVLTGIVIIIRRRQEKALETERILNAPLSKFEDEESEDLASRYL